MARVLEDLLGGDRAAHSASSLSFCFSAAKTSGLQRGPRQRFASMRSCARSPGTCRSWPRRRRSALKSIAPGLASSRGPRPAASALLQPAGQCDQVHASGRKVSVRDESSNGRARDRRDRYGHRHPGRTSASRLRPLLSGRSGTRSGGWHRASDSPSAARSPTPIKAGSESKAGQGKGRPSRFHCLLPAANRINNRSIPQAYDRESCRTRVWLGPHRRPRHVRG